MPSESLCQIGRALQCPLMERTQCQHLGQNVAALVGGGVNHRSQGKTHPVPGPSYRRKAGPGSLPGAGRTPGFPQLRPGESWCRYPRQTGLSLPKCHAVFILEAGGDRHRLFRRIRKRLVFQYRDGARSPHRRMSPSLQIQSAAGTPAKQRAAAPAFSNSSTLTPPPCPVGSSGIMMAGLLKTDHILWRVMEA